MMNKEKFEKDVKEYLVKNLTSEIQNDENQNYIILLAKTYYTDETTEGKFAEYIEEIIDEKNVREPLISKIKSLKHQYNSTSNDQSQTESIKVKQQPTKTVEERLTTKPQKVEGEEKSKKFHPRQKNKNGQEKVEGQTRKRVKKQQGDGENKQGENKGQLTKAGLKRKLESEGKQKCKFFPFCKNEQTCQFFHPTEKKQTKIHQKSTLTILIKKKLTKVKHNKNCGFHESQCTYFPNCKHGEDCLYIHESCKFKEKCTKFGCPYAHPFKKGGNILEDMIKGYMMQHQNPFANKKKAKKSQKAEIKQ